MRVLTKRQKVLIALIHKFSLKKMSSNLGIVKGLFLLKEEEHMGDLIKFYSFLPYKYGPFSYDCYRDLNTLRENGYITQDEKTVTQKGMEIAQGIDQKTSQKIKNTALRFESVVHMKNYVYKQYPSYTVKSELVPHEEKKAKFGIFSIGYEGHDIDSFLNILIQNEIDILVDVRKNPFSMNFSFTKGKLSYYLNKVGIKYMHVPELGIKGELRKNLNSEQDYQDLFAMYENVTIKEHSEKIKKIIELGKISRIAIMCFEKDLHHCHRSILSQRIEIAGMGVTHI